MTTNATLSPVRVGRSRKGAGLGVKLSKSLGNKLRSSNSLLTGGEGDHSD